MRFSTKYRPKTLERIIGQESAVSTLKQMAANGEYPSAILFSGPTSAGKTTMARAFAYAVLGDEGMNSSYEEVNLSEARSIEEVRGLTRLSNLRPMTGGHRFILCDEAQGVLGNGPAAQALLKPLEEPSPTTTWLLTTMEIDRFRASDTGRAILGRCLHIRLDPPNEESRRKFAVRIAKAEKNKALTPDVIDLVAGKTSSFREVANVMEVVANGGDAEHTLMGISANESEDAEKVLRCIVAVLKGDYMRGVTFLFNIKNGVDAIRHAGYLAWNLLALEAADGQKVPGVWVTKQSVAAWKALKEKLEDEARVALIADLNATVTELKISAGAFAVNESQALAAALQRLHSRHYQ